jgi:putative thioredoxin
VANSKWVIDVTMENFQTVVVEGSRERPIVIDFWAEWCQPCRMLAPMLEALAEEKAGAFILAKVNTDENPDLAQAFQIEGIPAVFAIRDGQIANHFTGLMPEEALREFIDSLGTGEPAKPRERTPLELAQELEANNPAGAITAYRDMLVKEPNDPAARVGLARVLLANTHATTEAATLLTGVEFGDFAEEAKRLNTIVALREIPHADTDLKNAQSAPDNAGKLTLARVLAARGDYANAIETLLTVADDDRQLGRTTVREIMLQIFEVIGARSPQADEARRRLQNLLY